MRSRAKLLTGEFIDIPVRATEKDGVITVIPEKFDW